jgi:NADH dehydrogenase [ubiquinone] 1 alpha subcomplex assembly factor 7
MGPDDSDRPSPRRNGEPSIDRSVDPVLRGRLRAAADPEGFLPFDRFMEISLYEPGRGFYDRSTTRLGRAGDFYTAAHVHGLFGATLADHFRQIRQVEGNPPGFPIVEVGPGDGTLAADIRTALRRLPASAADWEYILVERSAALRSAIEARLGAAVPGDVPWRFAPSLASAGPVGGIVLANELLDAFPFRRLQSTGPGWSELGVIVPPDGPLRPGVLAPGRNGLPADLPSNAPVGTVLEVSPTMEGWIRELADHLTGGRAVLIDYGVDEEVLLSRGPAGTIEAIRDHHPVDPLSRPGTADISAWVNFTRVRRAAHAAGLRETFYGPLSEALLSWGVDEVRAQLEAEADQVEAVKLRLAQKSFLMGFASFKVLELTPPGVPS